tara:strand:+ start:225 stop:446 length:222 start_codon:yes stop_codon:yes gene_type:complete
MKENQIKVLDYNQRESFFPLPVGEFRWHFKHLFDPSVYETVVRRTTRDVLANIKPIKNTLKRCFVLLKNKGGH